MTGRTFRRAGVLANAPVADAETVIEVTYRASVMPWLTVQPDAQLFYRPGFDPARKTGIAVGMRFELTPFATE